MSGRSDRMYHCVRKRVFWCLDGVLLAETVVVMMVNEITDWDGDVTRQSGGRAHRNRRQSPTASLRRSKQS
jgi:hypothetical protein